MSYTGQRVELCREERNRPTKTRLRRPPGLSRASILLLMVCSTYGFCMTHAEQEGIVTATSPAKSENAAEKRPVTVADFIQMTRLGDSLYNDGGSSKDLVAKFSPDGRAVRRGPEKRES